VRAFHFRAKSSLENSLALLACFLAPYSVGRSAPHSVGRYAHVATNDAPETIETRMLPPMSSNGDDTNASTEDLLREDLTDGGMLEKVVGEDMC